MRNALNVKLQKDKNQHKFALIWASKAHKFINGLLRSPKVIRNMHNNPAISYFAKNFIEYFYSHGVMPKDIGAKSLYRGIGEDVFQMHAAKDAKDKTYSIKDQGFIAVSKEIHIAEDFAGRDGMLMKFKRSSSNPICSYRRVRR